MNKVQANKITAGTIIKVKRVEYPNGASALIGAHTKSAATAMVTGVEVAGRYIFLDTTAGQIMIGAGGKLSIA